MKRRVGIPAPAARAVHDPAVLLAPPCIAQATSRRRSTHTSPRRRSGGGARTSATRFINLCLPSRGPRRRAGRGTRRSPRPGRGANATPDRTTWYAPPFKVFDNLYWLGTRQHSSWALQTSARHRHPRHELRLGHGARDHRRARPNSASIRATSRYVVISHAHGDHDQGAAELQKRFGAKVVMGAARLGVHAAAPGHRCRRRPDARTSPSGPTATKLTLGDTAIRSSRRRATRLGHCRSSSPSRLDGQTRDGGVFGRHLTGAFGTNARAVGRVHQLAAQDRQGRRRRRRDA